MTRRALELAAMGVGLVSPNPLVGCVIVSADSEIVGEGTYYFEKTVHAEAVAIEQAGGRARGGTAYISLEPHDHHGKTAPCTDALIHAGIKRVVCPIEDPNPLVSGKGFERLKNSGIEVDTGILSDEASKLNEKFICWHRLGRPFVHLKLAASADGRISLRKSVSTALTGDAGRERVQLLRHEYDAILVGGNTAFTDDPGLTDRSGRPRRGPLLRVVLDNRLRLPVDSKLVRTSRDVPTMVFTNSSDLTRINELKNAGATVIETDSRDLPAVLAELKRVDIQSVLVEGGAEIAGAFCDADLVDKVTFMMAPLVIGGDEAPVAIRGKGAASLESAIRLSDIDLFRHGTDIEITGYPSRESK
ncbi:MAG: bifunctional diaminohydroxyphosphoribosylaminopyrimidine deaminase/5-amino-6-(5-phosphoribosylamino)uracil reductase RibD [Acidobacteriota bacterium]